MPGSGRRYNHPVFRLGWLVTPCSLFHPWSALPELLLDHHSLGPQTLCVCTKDRV